MTGKQLTTALALTIATTFAFGHVAQADTFSSGPESDTWVGFFNNGNNDFGNRNGDVNMEAQGDFDSNARQGRILLRYDLSSIANDSIVTSATLTIRAGTYYNLTGSPQAATVEVRHIVEGNPWTQTGATWQTYDGTNAWDQTGGVGGGDTGTLAGTGNFVSSTVHDTFNTPAPNGNNLPIGAPIVLDITALVQAWVDGSLENNGLSIQMANGFTGTSFLITIPRSESAAPDTTPLLSVEYTPIPEPGALGLLGAGLIALLYRRRA